MADNTTFIDFETYYDDEYSIQGSTYWHYVNSPKFRAYQVALVGEGLSYVGPVESAPWDKVIGRPLVAHNAAFDKAVLERLIELNKVPNMRTPSFHCSMDLCAYHQMPRALNNAAKEVLGLTVSKAVRAQMKGKTWESLSASEREALSAYALKDSEICRDLWTKLSDTWPEKERFLSDHTRDAGMRGLDIDVEALRKAIDLLRTSTFYLGKMLPWFTSSDIKPMSLVHIREQGRKDGIEVPGSLDLRDPDAIAWEAKYAPQFGWVRALRGYRRVNALLKKLETLESMCRPDGTAPYQLKYFGAAATGRWSGSGGYNIHNNPKFPIVVCKKCWGCNFDDGALEETNGGDTMCPFCKSTDVEFIDMRALFLPPKGKVFIVSDYAQIEARMLLWQVKDFVTLAQVSKGESVYEAHARATMGWTGADLKNADKKLYALAKARVLGAGYGCGPAKFVTVAKIMARLEITLDEAKTAIYEYRDSNPLVTNRWRQHQFWLKVSANHGDESHEVELKNGRVIKYFNPHVLPDGDPSRPEIAANVVKGDARQLRRFYGGKLTENETQANARNILGEGIIGLEKAGMPVLFHVHDEVVYAVDACQAKEAAREGDHILTTAAEWAHTCPLGVETKTSDRYFGK